MAEATRRRRLPLGEVDDATLGRAGTSREEFEVATRFLEVMRAMSVRLETVAVETGLNAQTLLALMQLDVPMSQKRLATSLGCDPSYVTAIVDRLEAIDAVERVTAPEDRRVKLVTLTDVGVRLRDDTAVRLLERVPATLGLDAADVDVLAQLLARLVEANREVLEDEDPWGVAG